MAPFFTRAANVGGRMRGAEGVAINYKLFPQEGEARGTDRGAVVFLTGWGEAFVMAGSVDCTADVAVLPQRPFVIAGTVLDNILVGRPSSSPIALPSPPHHPLVPRGRWGARSTT